MFIEEELTRYFYWIEEREKIRILKEVDKRPPPWTEDPILRVFKFCQVFREDDRTTRWFRAHIRLPLPKAQRSLWPRSSFAFLTL